MMPGPLGIAETRPIADAPLPMASSASECEETQHTFKRMVVSRIPYA
jgi:hypothetical protein